jgi:hypothetical protein
MIRMCRCKIARAGAIAGVCICGGLIAPATVPGHLHRPVAVAQISAAPAEHYEQPHIPHLEGSSPQQADMAAVTPGFFTFDDPVLGRFDLNPLA